MVLTTSEVPGHDGMARVKERHRRTVEKGREVQIDPHESVESSDLVVDLGDMTTLTAGGEDSSTESKRNPYD